METVSPNVLSLPGPGLEPQRLAAADAILIRVPRANGSTIELCRQIHGLRPELPMLVLAGEVSLEEKIALLESAADEVLVEPVDQRELDARIKAMLRRSTAAAPANFRFGDIHVDFLRGRLFKNGRQIPLPAKELLLLRQLIEHRGVTLSRAALLHDVWGHRSAFTRTVDVHVAMLRQRLEDHPQKPRYILTVRGKGYQFRAESVSQSEEC
ncbi:MAG TPA: response regulator transcription factor [Bryobacteraceae bacterium]|nr:response regulator transcription factor [Bryobacteraceae bacterium]